MSSLPIFQKTNKIVQPSRKGIYIQGPDALVFSAGSEIWIEGVLAFEASECDAENYEQWLRSIFVTVISQINQAPAIANLLKDELVFAHDIQIRSLQDGTQAVVVNFKFEPASVLGSSLEDEACYVQLSARQYCSNIVLMKCERGK